MLSLFSQLPTTIAAIPIWDEYTHFLRWVLNDVLAENLHSGALSIIVFTIIVKTLLLPLTIKSIRSSKAMQELQPKIAELKKKYGKDRQELSAQTMALYRQYSVNPMAGCLPMIIQIPIFFGVYHAINNLSNSGVGYWANGFLWLPDLGEADPWHILPFVAAAFQFVQTKMMRPAGQGKISDPQQAMMNTMMNFMPLTVIFFGWTFASGAVLYWAIQSVYSVVQQWLITGWGQMKDWIPGLPEMPEHRRLGYVAPRNLDDVVVVSGEVPEQKGVMGWMQRRMAEAEKQAAARREARAGGAQPAKGRAGGAGSAEAAAKPAGGGTNGRPTRSGKNARGGRPGQAGQSGKAAKPTPISAEVDAAEPEVEEEAAPVSSRRRERRGSSYQARVDAALARGGSARRSGKSGN